MKKILFYSCLFLCLGCGNNNVNTENMQNQPVAEDKSETKITEEETDAITSATAVANEVTFNGVFVSAPTHHATITLPINGILKNASLLPGTYVRKGELLATFENLEFITLQQEFIESYAQTEYLEAEYKRQEVLSREEAASQKKFQQSKAEYLSMKSKMDATSAKLSVLGINTENLINEGIQQLLQVRAPINGYISGVQMNIGKHIAAGEPLCEIIDKSNPLIKLSVYEKDLALINQGDEIEFRVNGIGNENFTGKIVSVGQQVDNINRSLEVFASIDKNDERFRPGMYVNVRIIRK